MSELESWDVVEKEVEQVIAASTEAFDFATIRNAYQFLEACRARKCSIPSEIAKGYWNTICVSWERIEVEILADRFEFYRFSDGATAIEYFEHAGGSEVSDELLVRLPCRKMES